MSELLSRHTTQWFHYGKDEISPAIMMADVSKSFLEYITFKKLSLTISERQFRHNMCEFLCTIYVANKKNELWRGPFSKLNRPVGWTRQNELEWEEYLSHEYFSHDFWFSFWKRFPEVSWEVKVPYWREFFQCVVLHYINLQANKIEFMEEDTDSIAEDSD